MAVERPGTDPRRRALGRPRVHLRRTDSTNARARALAISGAPHGALVTASEQTAGRGRQGRSWTAPAGSSLLMSLLLREPPALLALRAAVAVCEVAGATAMIKWPNDIVLPSETATGAPVLAKLAGILIEGRPQQKWAVLGVGLNVAVHLEDLPAELRADAAGPPLGARRVAASMGLPAEEIEPTLARLIAALEPRLTESEDATLRAWSERDALAGLEIEWSGGSGRAQGIDGLGRLVVELAGGGRTALSAGEVHLHAIG